ncbi:MAG: hypothetical protein JWO42_3057 [Chloroflexi bacterium]|nr:hypothetical protein [Chloroflexota bacterium]
MIRSDSMTARTEQEAHPRGGGPVGGIVSGLNASLITTLCIQVGVSVGAVLRAA